MATTSDFPRVAVVSGRDIAERYWARTYRFAAMVTRNDQDAADVAQEAMERAIRNLHHYSPSKGTVEAWLWRIVINAARDAGRASVRQSALLERLIRFQLAVPAEDAERVALDRITDAELLEAVRSLKARPRTLIALRFGAQLSFAEIADQTGITEAAALMATKRALASLRQVVGEKR